MPPVQSCIFLFYLQNVLLSECPGPDINVWILVEKTPTFFFSSKPILIDFCLTFQTEDSKPFPKIRLWLLHLRATLYCVASPWVFQDFLSFFGLWILWHYLVFLWLLWLLLLKITYWTSLLGCPIGASTITFSMPKLNSTSFWSA